MAVNPKIWLITADLGYKMWDKVFEDYPDRAINPGAAEQTAMDLACGLALEGKIPFVYSITSFLLFRPFEAIRTYINHEKLNVKLVGGGRDKDYEHDGISHWSEDAHEVLNTLTNIGEYWPETKESIPSILDEIIKFNGPDFVSLRR